MIEKRQIWRLWVRALHRLGLKPLAAWLLEATQPIHLLGAQLVYVGQPLLNVFLPENHAPLLAQTLEEPDETQAFVHFLREGEAP